MYDIKPSAQGNTISKQGTTIARLIKYKTEIKAENQTQRLLCYRPSQSPKYAVGYFVGSIARIHCLQYRGLIPYTLDNLQFRILFLLGIVMSKYPFLSGLL
jgi:hypothetical protein